MEFEKLIKERYSCRKFSNRKIEKEVLEKILEAGQIAPTAKNVQPFTIYVLQSENMIEKINTLSPCIYGAKTVLVFTYKKDEVWTNPYTGESYSGIEDVSIVATHIMLSAKNLGVDSCWINYYSAEELEKELNIFQTEKSVLIMPLGYADNDSKPSPMHTKKKDIKELVKYL